MFELHLLQWKLARREQNREFESMEGHFILGLRRDKSSWAPHFMALPARRSQGCGFLSILLGASLPFVSICIGTSSEGFYSKPTLISSGSAPRHPSPGFRGNLSFLSLRITICRWQHRDPEMCCNLAKNLIPQLGLPDLYSQAVDGHCT